MVNAAATTERRTRDRATAAHASVLGAAKHARESDLHPAILRDQVITPGGTTIAAIRELETAGVRAAFLNAIQAAMIRARELGAGDQ